MARRGDIYAIGRVDWRTRECLRLSSAKANGERFRDARVCAAEVWAIYQRAGQTWLAEMRAIVGSRRAPTVEWMNICRACSYADLCWG